MLPPKLQDTHDCASLVEQAIAEHRAGHSEIATRLYATAIDMCPDHPEANHNLGILLLQSGNSPEALAHFRTALENDADRELYWLSFARALLISGRAADAIAVLEKGAGHILDEKTVADFSAQALAPSGAGSRAKASLDVTSLAATQARAMAARGEVRAAIRRLENAIAAKPAETDALRLQLGDLLAESGEIARAIRTFRDALTINPGFAQAHHHLGSILSENGKVDEGFAHLMKRAALVHGAMPEAAEPEPAHKVKHDREQAEYLFGHGMARGSGSLPFTIAEGSRVEGNAVNPRNGGKDLKAQWENASPRFLVIDDFLMPDALDRLRGYCAGSTIWKRVYDAGYIGATPEDGFASPLLAQIVEEIQDVYAPILTSHPFRYLGAFKYDSELSTGTNTHADFSAVNVNLYITPDEANLASDRGGMVIWDLAARSEEELRYYNGHEQELCNRLERTAARAHHIPHRANRAVIFASSLFHRTDDCSFREGYLNKRINVSFLFGDWPSNPV